MILARLLAAVEGWRRRRYYPRPTRISVSVHRARYYPRPTRLSVTVRR